MGLKYEDFSKVIKELDAIVDADTEVCFVDEYGETYPAKSIITIKKDGKTVLVIE